MAKGKKKDIAIDAPEENQDLETAAEETAEAEAPETAAEAASEQAAAETDLPENEPAEDQAEEAGEPETSSGEEQPETGEEEKTIGGFFKKKARKDKKDELIEEMTDRLQRQMAEFENFRRRSEKEKSGMYDMGVRDAAEKLLPVIDNFERGLASAEEGDAFAEGMKMIYKQLMTMLADLGVEPMDAVGKEFDPNLHNAVMHIDDDSLGENTVAEELQKGYLYKGHVVRHSMVKVAN